VNEYEPLVGGAALKTAESLLASARYALFGRGGVEAGAYTRSR
jgi:hypothetical protein